MNTPLVSILTPVYNRRDYIGQCIESSLSQTFDDFELVIVDNASTDGTWEICQRFAAKDPRIRLFRNPTNIGAIPNWIRSFEEARGRFGKIVFSDDLIPPRSLKRTVPLMTQDVAFVVTPAEIGATPGSGIINYQWKQSTGIFPASEYFAATLRRNAVPCSPVSTLFRISDLRKNLRTDIASPSIPDFAVHAAGPDLLLSLLTASAYSKVAFVAEPLAFFRDHPGTLTHAIQDRLFDCYSQVRVSFGVGRRDVRYASCALAAAWLRQMGAQKRWIRPGEMKSRFLCDPSAITNADLLAAAVRITGMRLDEGMECYARRRNSSRCRCRLSRESFGMENSGWSLPASRRTRYTKSPPIISG